MSSINIIMGLGDIGLDMYTKEYHFKYTKSIIYILSDSNNIYYY